MEKILNAQGIDSENQLYGSYKDVERNRTSLPKIKTKTRDSTVVR